METYSNISQKCELLVEKSISWNCFDHLSAVHGVIITALSGSQYKLPVLPEVADIISQRLMTTNQPCESIRISHTY